MFSALPRRWLTLAFALLALALCLGNPILLAGAIYVLLIVLMGAALVAPSRIEVSRSTPRLVCWAGDGLDVNRQVEAGEGVGPLYVYDRLPPEAEVNRGNNLRAIWKRPGARTYDLSYRISWPKRGVYTLEETAWEAEAPLGLHQRIHGSAGPSLEISVVPRTQAIRKVNEIRGRAHSRNPWEDVALVGASSTDFTELRPTRRETRCAGLTGKPAPAVPAAPTRCWSTSMSRRAERRSGFSWMAQTTWTWDRHCPR